MPHSWKLGLVVGALKQDNLKKTDIKALLSPEDRKGVNNMPQGDRTGSQGQGPKGGRGLGKCNSKNSTPTRGGQGSAGDGRGQGRGLGKGAGRGQGRGKGAGQGRRRQS